MKCTDSSCDAEWVINIVKLFVEYCVIIIHLIMIDGFFFIVMIRFCELDMCNTWHDFKFVESFTRNKITSQDKGAY